MHQDDRKNLDPGGTIQIDPGDALNQVQLTDTPAPPASTASNPPASRKTPPPLPPSVSSVPVLTQAVPAAPPVPVENQGGKKPVTARTIVLFVVVAAVFAIVGVTVGTWARAQKTPPAPAASPLVLPPVEMQSPESPSAVPSSP